MLSSRLHDQLADSGVARVKDVIESLLQNLGRLRDTTVDQSYLILIEIFGPQLLQELSTVDAQFTRFDQSAVSRSDRADKWHERKLVWVIPGAFQG